MKQTLKIGQKLENKFITLRDFLYVTEDLDSTQTLHIMTKCRELFGEPQLIPKTKKVKKWKYTREQIYSALDSWDINSFGHCNSTLNRIKRELLATQPQPIKEDLPKRIKDGDKTFILVDEKTCQYKEEPKQEESKEIDDDIDPIEIETDLSTKRKYVDGLEITQLDEFLINKINLMIFFINSLTNRNIK